MGGMFSSLIMLQYIWGRGGGDYGKDNCRNQSGGLFLEGGCYQ